MKRYISFTVLLTAALMWGCVNDSPKTGPAAKAPEQVKVKVPGFDADSAYAFVKKQVDFGPRTPGSRAHRQCADWLVRKLKSYGATVTVQPFKARAYNGKDLSGKNIIASFNPQAQKRIMLSSHWDSRPFADHDPDPANRYKPIDGANDGASGVGVLIELARLMSQQQPKAGVDIMLWDLEDYGRHSDEEKTGEDSWALGSKYWSQNPHIAGYTARYGILLDMVGAENPTFTKEYYSMMYAPGVVNKVWNTAAMLGYDHIFLPQEAGAVMDDHFYVNKYAHIPTIDIIHYDASNSSGFFPYWHTLGDNMSVISKSTLGIVGETLAWVVFNE